MIKILTFFVVFFNAVISDPKIWDGAESDFNVKFRISSFKSISIFSEDIIPPEKRYIKNEIKVFPHLTIKNVIIYPLDISNIKSEYKGFDINYQGNSGLQTYFVTYSGTEDLRGKDYSSCHLAHCEIGLYFYHNFYLGNQLTKHKIYKFNTIIYITLTTSTSEYLLDKYEIKANSFPLMLCPHENWVSKESFVKFHLIENNGIEYDSFYKRHILLPIYERRKGDNKYICGKLKYLEGRDLNIGFELVINKMLENGLSIKEIDITEDDLVCSIKYDERNYYHFVYNDNDENDIKMKFINVKHFDNTSLYHGEPIYLYEKLSSELDVLKNKGFENNINNRNKVHPKFEPSCVIKIKPIFGKLRLKRKDGKNITLENNPLTGTKIWYVTKELLNKKIDLVCEIDIEIKGRFNFKNFYKETFKPILVKPYSKDNVKYITNIKFTEDMQDFGNYECRLKSIRNDNVVHIIDEVQKLSFETIPTDDKIFVENYVWENDKSINVRCKNNIENLANLTRMIVIINSDYFYNYPNEMDYKLFYLWNGFLQFNYESTNEKYIFKLNYECFYQSRSNINFSKKVIGIIPSNKIKARQEAFQSENINNSLLVASIVIITISILVIATMAVVVVVSIVRKRERKRHSHHYHRRHHIHHKKEKPVISGIQISVKGSATGNSK